MPSLFVPPGLRFNDSVFSEPVPFAAWAPPACAGILVILRHHPQWSPKPFQPLYFGAFGNDATRAATLPAIARMEGLLISTLTKNQFAASQAALIAAFLPAFELSGFIFEIDSMPLPIRLVTYVLPARYLVASLQTLFLAGNVTEVLLPAVFSLLATAAILFTLLVRVTRMRLE